MNVSYQWLLEFLPEKPSLDRVVQALRGVGIAVEHVNDLAKGFENVVSAKLISVAKHPSADRLTLCQVSDGTTMYSVVCGATNHKQNDVVALAKPGAKLVSGMEIKKSKIRGETSEGMLCSESELGLKEESEGILIFPPDTRLGESVATLLGRNDAVLEIELTPNRGDCLSVIGIAREAAAALAITPGVPTVTGKGTETGGLNAVVEDRQGCLRYVLRSIEGVSAKPSPTWMSARLEACGVRPINCLVDVTNYAMLEWGQPMHAFDRDQVKGQIHVRRAVAGEKILCLDDVDRTLSFNDLVIADAQGPIAIAGVMGGKRTAVSETTKSILLESAFFDPTSVRKTARALQCHTESSHRFERTVDLSATWAASERAYELYRDVAGGKEVGSTDVNGSISPLKKIHLRSEKLIQILGEDNKKAGEYLSRLGLTVEKLESGWMVEVPLRRPDLEREIDLVEEVARLHGLSQFISQLPYTSVEPVANESYDLFHRIRDGLRAEGLSEAKTYSFMDEWGRKNFEAPEPTDAVELKNPLLTGMNWLRTTLLPGLLQSWVINQSRQSEGIKIFEIGTVFSKTEEKPKLAVLLGGVQIPKTWNSPERGTDFYAIKGLVESLFDSLGLGGWSIEIKGPSFLHPGKSATLLFRRKPIGSLGILHPRILRELGLSGDVAVIEMDLSSFVGASVNISHKSYSMFPKVSRDVAFIVPNSVSHESILAEIKKLKAPLIQEFRLFDFYQGKGIPEGHKSLAYRCELGSAERTLTDAEVDQCVKDLVNRIENQLGAKLRA